MDRRQTEDETMGWHRTPMQLDKSLSRALLVMTQEADDAQRSHKEPLRSG